jgi:hypothetical protein
MSSLLFYRRYYHLELTELRRRIKEIRREIRLNTAELTRLQSPAVSRPREEEDRRRFASYLSTGSFQTIQHHKFRSDLVRKKRLLWSLGIIAAAAAAILLIRYFN